MLSAVSGVRGRVALAQTSWSLSPDMSWMTSVSPSHSVEPSSLFEGKEKKSEQLKLILHPLKLGLSMGLTGTCSQMWGLAGSGWTAFPSSQRLELQAEVCRELEPEDRDQTDLLEPRGAEDKHVTESQTQMNNMRCCWNPRTESGGHEKTSSAREPEKVTRVTGEPCRNSEGSGNGR